MKRSRSALLLVVAVCAIGAVLAGAAQAAEGPFYRIAGKRLASGAKQALTATHVVKAFEMKNAKVAITIQCNVLKPENAQLLGSTGANSSTSEETLVFEECKQTGNGEKCVVEGSKIKTETLTDTLGYSEEGRTGKLLMLFTPQAGGVVAKVKFAGTCLKAEGMIEGSVAAEAWSGGKALEVAGEPEAEVPVVELNFPENLIKSVFVEKAGVVEKKSPVLKIFAGEMKLEGRAEAEIEGGKKWGVFSVEQTPHYISGGSELTAEEKGKGTIGQFFLEVPGLSFTVLCEGVDNTVRIGAKWNGSLAINFTECSVVSRPECKVVEPIEIPLLDQLIYKAGKRGEEIQEIFYSKKEGTFGGLWSEVEILNNGLETCPATIKGKYEIKGSAIGVPSPGKPGETAEKINIKFKGTESPTGEFLNRKTGKSEKAGTITVNGKAANLKGEISQELESHALYGAE